MIEPSRRRFLAGAAAFLAMPAVIRVAPMMKIAMPPPALVSRGNTLLTISMITREAVKFFVNSNAFFYMNDSNVLQEFGSDKRMRANLPNDYAFA